MRLPAAELTCDGSSQTAYPWVRGTRHIDEHVRMDVLGDPVANAGCEPDAGEGHAMHGRVRSALADTLRQIVWSAYVRKETVCGVIDWRGGAS
jgi:hypothetical protein